MPSIDATFHRLSVDKEGESTISFMPSIDATFHRLSVDKEGESTISFKVPQSDLPKALSISTLTEELLKLTVEPEDG